MGLNWPDTSEELPEFLFLCFLLTSFCMGIGSIDCVLKIAAEVNVTFGKVK
jgi:hypothetical protein